MKTKVKKDTSSIDTLIELTTTKELQYTYFKKVLDKSTFSITEWAGLLQLSERTIHRYAKENLAFNGILSERILSLEKVIDTGIETFGVHFKEWLQSQPFTLNGNTPMAFLYTQEGIVFIYKMMQRLQHGVIQ